MFLLLYRPFFVVNSHVRHKRIVSLQSIHLIPRWIHDAGDCDRSAPSPAALSSSSLWTAHRVSQPTLSNSEVRARDVSLTVSEVLTCRTCTWHMRPRARECLHVGASSHSHSHRMSRCRPVQYDQNGRCMIASSAWLTLGTALHAVADSSCR